MSRRAAGIVLLVLSFPLLMLGLAAGREAAREADVRASQLRQSVSAPSARDRDDFARFAASTLARQASAEHNRNSLLAVAVLGVIGAVVLFLPERRRAAVHLPQPVAAGAGPPPPPPPAQFRACRACQWQISVEAAMCPRCGCPHEPQTAASATALATAAEPPAPVSKLQRAFYIALLVLGLGSAVVIYTVLFNDLSETRLVQISPYWIFPSVFGYYGLVAQRMEARLPASHLDNVSDQLLNVIKEIGGPIGQAFSFLLYAPFLIVKSQRPWVVAFVGSLLWAMALVVFFSVIFPEL